MDTEKKQKKDYVTPEMMEVEMFHKRDLCLLECSDGEEGLECLENNPFA